MLEEEGDNTTAFGDEEEIVPRKGAIPIVWRFFGFLVVCVVSAIQMCFT